MATVPRAKERTARSPQTEAMASGTQKKRKHHSHCGKVTRISQIKCALEEIITNTDPKESEASEILEYLTTAREALEMAGSLLLSNEKMHKILTEPPRPKHDLTMVGRSFLFHQWQARRVDPTCPTCEKISSCQAPVREQG